MASPKLQKPAEVVVMGVALSHPDRPLWPGDGPDAPITKPFTFDQFAARTRDLLDRE